MDDVAGTVKRRKTLDGAGVAVGTDGGDPQVAGFRWQPAQRAAMAALAGQPNFVLMLAVGLGKTLVAVREMLLTPGWSLVVSSKTVQGAWVRQLAEWYPNAPFVAVRSTKAHRKADLARAAAMIGAGVNVIVSVTYPHLSTGGTAVLEGLPPPGMVVVDENSLRNLSTKKVAALWRLRAPTSRFLMLTATPYQNSAADLISLSLLMGARSFGYDGSEVTAGDPQGRINTLAKNMCPIVANQIYDYLADKILIIRATDNPWAVTRRVISDTGADALDMPTIRAEAMEVLAEIDYLSRCLSGTSGSKWNRERWKFRKSLLIARKKRMDAMLVNKETERFSEPLRCCLNAFLDTHHDATRPLLIFANYHTTRNAVARYLQERGFAVSQFTADLSASERRDAIRRFQADDAQDGPRVLVVGIKVLREGVTLTRAFQTVFIPETFNPMDYVQAEGRTNRQGQATDVEIYYLVSRLGDTARVFKTIRLKFALAEMAMRALEHRELPAFSHALTLAANPDIRAVAKGGIEGLVAAENLPPAARKLVDRYVPRAVMDENFPGLAVSPLE